MYNTGGYLRRASNRQANKPAYVNWRLGCAVENKTLRKCKPLLPKPEFPDHDMMMMS